MLAAELVNQPGVIAAGEYSYRGDRFNYKGQINAEMARMALFLASDESLSCTGGDFIVDAGLTVGAHQAGVPSAE